MPRKCTTQEGLLRRGSMKNFHGDVLLNDIDECACEWDATPTIQQEIYTEIPPIPREHPSKGRTPPPTSKIDKRQECECDFHYEPLAQPNRYPNVNIQEDKSGDSYVICPNYPQPDKNNRRTTHRSVKIAARETRPRPDSPDEPSSHPIQLRLTRTCSGKEADLKIQPAIYCCDCSSGLRSSRRYPSPHRAEVPCPKCDPPPTKNERIDYDKLCRPEEQGNLPPTPQGVMYQYCQHLRFQGASGQRAEMQTNYPESRTDPPGRSKKPERKPLFPTQQIDPPCVKSWHLPCKLHKCVDE